MSEPADDRQSIDDELFDAARKGDVEVLARLLDAHPAKRNVRAEPYEWSLLHLAANGGHLAAVDLLLRRGLDVNTRERGDNTYAMHWAAAAGHLEIVRRLADAGGDVVGKGDDHALEVIGWATCWNNRHAAVADFLVSRGARHHIFSAVAMNLTDEVRRIVAANPAALNSRLTRNDDHRTPLHVAVMNNRPEMVGLLLDLGADPLATDGSGQLATMQATAPATDRRVMEKIREMLSAELDSAERGNRPPHIRMMDLAAILALGEWELAEDLLRRNPGLLDSGGAAHGVLHLMAKRNDLAALRWLLEHGADPNARWPHWDADVTALHLAAAQGHTEVVRLLLTAGADARIKDSKHDGDAAGWAEYGRIPPVPHWREIVKILETGAARS